MAYKTRSKLHTVPKHSGPAGDILALRTLATSKIPGVLLHEGKELASRQARGGSPLLAVSGNMLLAIRYPSVQCTLNLRVRKRFYGCLPVLPHPLRDQYTHLILAKIN